MEYNILLKHNYFTPKAGNPDRIYFKCSRDEHNSFGDPQPNASHSERRLASPVEAPPRYCYGEQNHSERRLDTGFASAALMACTLIVSRVIKITAAPVIPKTSMPIGIR